MQRCASFLFLSLILGATLSETFGLVFSAKEKRGWTLNSAGYLLGPHAVDNHRSFNDKHGFTGKREIQPDEDIKAGVKAAAVQQWHKELGNFDSENCPLKGASLFPEMIGDSIKDFKEKGISGNLGRPLSDDNIMRTVIEFLTYLHLKELGALEKLPTPEETNQS